MILKGNRKTSKQQDMKITPALAVTPLDGSTKSELCLLGSASEKILSCVSRLESTFPARQLIRNLLRYKLYNLLQCCFAPIFLFHGVMAVQRTVSFICYLSISSHSLTVFTAKTQSQSCLQAPTKCHYTVLFLSTPADLI